MSAADPSHTWRIATDTQSASGWTLVTPTGQTLSGNDTSLQPDGFLVGRGSAAFHCKTGYGVKNSPIAPRASGVAASQEIAKPAALQAQ